jgi:D-xylose transport system substrate-binding protein
MVTSTHLRAYSAPRVEAHPIRSTSHLRRSVNVSIRKSAAALSVVAMVFAACGQGGTASKAPTTGPVATPAATTPAATAAGSCHVGVAWATFQEERYGLRDEPGLKTAVEAGGGKYTGNDAKLSPETQAANVESLIAAGVNVIVINAQDPVAILPSVQKAIDAGIPVIAYDRELENAKALFLTHDNVEVGRMIARAVTAAAPEGNYAIIKGELGQTNPLFLREGMEEIIAPLIASGAITIPPGAEVNTPGWKPENAQAEMEQILTANDNDIQAVLSQNDGMAGGAIAALTAQGLAGKVIIGGQDGDKQALNRVALGTQIVSVWKDATDLGKKAGEAALQLCKDPDITKVSGATPSKTVGGLDSTALLLAPVPITKDNLQVVLDANWITKDELCLGVTPGSVAGC